MNKKLARPLVGLWILVATVALARLWLRHAALFPRLPEPFVIWLIELYGSTNGEELADLDTVFALGTAFVLVSAITALALFVLRRVKYPAQTPE